MQSSPLPPGGYGPQAGQTIYYGQPYSPYVGMPPQGGDEHLPPHDMIGVVPSKNPLGPLNFLTKNEKIRLKKG